MPSMTKLVNITTSIPVRTVTPPLHGTYKGIIMTTGDILKCISRRAIVDEILPNGTTVRLTIRNYYTDNGAGLDAAERASAKVAKTSVEEPKVEKTIEEEVITPSNENVSEVDNINQVPEAPVENAETSEEDQAPVVETSETETETEPEASVEPVVEEEVAQANEEPPAEGDVDELRPTSTTKKASSKKSNKRNPSTKKPEVVIEANPETDSVE